MVNLRLTNISLSIYVNAELKELIKRSSRSRFLTFVDLNVTITYGSWSKLVMQIGMNHFDTSISMW
jgi:hypothetical protein